MSVTPLLLLKGLTQLMRERPDLANEITAVVALKLSDGLYTLDFGARRCFKGPPEGKIADCTFIMSTDDFVALITKQKDAMELFMEQKMQIEGDMGLAMEFSAVFDEISAEDAVDAAKRGASKL